MRQNKLQASVPETRYEVIRNLQWNKIPNYTDFNFQKIVFQD